MKNENEVNAAESRIKDEEVAKHTIKYSISQTYFRIKNICSSYTKPCIRKIQR